jgi:hypothetical protein
MERDDVRIGTAYTAKIGSGTAPVEITGERWKGEKHTGWVGVNLDTDQKVYIRTALHLKPLTGPAKAAKLATAGAVGEPGVVTGKAASPVPPKPASGKRGGKGGPKAAKGGKPAKAAPKGDKAKPAGKDAAKAKPAANKPAAPKPPKEKRVSALDAAAKVLAEAKKPMRVGEIVEQMAAKGYWESKAGRTPAATVYAAIIREIFDKQNHARFRKVEKGLFAYQG